MALDDTLKQLMKQLGAAINESLSESETVSDAMADIRAAGYDVFLILEATIGFHRRDAEAAGEVSPEGLVSANRAAPCAAPDRGAARGGPDARPPAP